MKILIESNSFNQDDINLIIKYNLKLDSIFPSDLYLEIIILGEYDDLISYLRKSGFLKDLSDKSKIIKKYFID